MIKLKNVMASKGDEESHPNLISVLYDSVLQIYDFSYKKVIV